MIRAVTTLPTRAPTPEPGPLTKEVAGIIKGKMARYSVSQKEMAGPVGVDQSQLSKMIRGLRPITIDQLEVMCAVLGVEIDDVIEEAHTATHGRGEWPPVEAIVLEGVRVR